MAQMTRTSQLSGKALAGAAVSRRPFTSARAAPRNLVVRAEQGPNDAAMKVIGAVAAAQIALLPLAGAAAADVFPSIGAIGSANPAEQFAAKSKATVNKAKAAVAPDPIETLQAKTKAAAQDAKSVVAKNGVVPDPVKDLQNKAKAATKKVSNPAVEFANKGKKAVNKAVPAAKKAANKAKVSNPAKEFAAKAQQAKQKAKGTLAGTPLATIGMNDLQKDVLFGFGEKKASKVANKAADKASDVADKASDVADKASDAGETVAKKVDESTPNSFSIFDADSVQDARQKLKANLDEAVNSQQDPSQGGDPAARVASVGKPGETQEENAERIRREAENGPVEGGDARAPTN